MIHTYQPAMKKRRDKIIEKVGFLAEKRDIPEKFDKSGQNYRLNSGQKCWEKKVGHVKEKAGQQEVKARLSDSW